MKIVSWNVNGLRAAEKKGFCDWLQIENPDVLGLQEIKAERAQLSMALAEPEGFLAEFNSASKKGYSGTAIYSRPRPMSVDFGLGIEKFDSEGRSIAADYGDFVFFNIYFPNGKQSPERLKYKMDFYDRAFDLFEQLKSQGKKLLIAGDFNTAHKEIDLARPKENESVSGFLPIERQWMDKLVAHGYRDCFRHFNQGADNYTWWSLRTAARKRNIGWRIDYFFASENLMPKIKDCRHLPEVNGSDHCPVLVELD